MSGVRLNVFSGIRPRVPESLLPENAATIAANCDFAYGELRSTKGGFLVSSLQNIPKSIYTDDGLTFYSWTADVNAVRSPIVNDQFNRLYYTGDGSFKVADRGATRINGGPPGTSYKVGVPRPSSAPALTVDIPTVEDLNAAFTFRFHYEYSGVKYQEQAVTPTDVSTGVWRFTPPTKSTSSDGGGGGSSVALSFNGFEVVWAGTPGNSTAVELAMFSADGDYFLYLPGWDAGPTPPTLISANDEGGGTIRRIYAYRERGWYSTSATAEVPSGGSVSTAGDGEGPTPDAAFPVLRITAKSQTDSSPIFDLYPSNSSFSSSGGMFSVELTKDDGAETYTATLTSAIKEADKVTRAYVYTYANIYNEEGPPSAPAIVTTAPLLAVSMTLKKDQADGFVPIKEIRIYRTPDASEIAEYFFVGSVQVLSQPSGAVVSHSDSVKGEMLNEPLSSLNNYPPDAALVGLMALPNGILCAWKGNELHFSEAYKPWAWPPAYVKPLANAVVGGIAHGSGAVITTTTAPYLLSGVSPDAMTAMRLNVDQAGVSKWSIAVVDGAVIYASHDGLVVINGASASLAQGQKFFTREVWRSLFPTGLATVRFASWDGRLVVFSGSGTFTPFMIRVDEADGTMTDLPDLVAQCHFVSQLSDQFYFARGNGVYQFQGGDELDAVWQSRELVLPRPLNYGFAQAVATGTWQIQFFADGALKHTQQLSSGTTNFRLPAGFMSDRWKVRIEGAGRMRELRFAETARELAAL